MTRQDTYDTGFDEQTGKHLSTDDCPECSGSLRTEAGETICTDCGLVLDAYRFDHRGPRTFPEDDDTRKRTGAPLTPARHDRGFTTTIGYTTDGTGTTLPGKKRRQLARLRREQSRAKYQSKAERNLAHGCGEIARLEGCLDLTHEVREQASSLFRRAQNEDLLLGRSVEAIAAGCVYAVCRCRGITRTLDEVVAVAQCSRSRLENAYRVLNTELGLPTPPQQPHEFIPAHASALGVSAATERRARQVARQAADAGLSIGANPSGFAAGCLAVAAAEHGESIQQSTLASVADVSPATVRTHRDTIRAELGGQSD